MSHESLASRPERFPLNASRLREERPRLVADASHAQFLATQRDMRDEYRYFGRNGHYRWKGHMAFVGNTNPLPPAQRVLDIGAGHGEYIKGLVDRGHQALGITAYDYSHGTNPSLLVADAHEFGSHLPAHLTTFDLVVSRWTLRHLADPLTCFEQMLNATALGGEIITDDFHFPADPDGAAIGKLVIGHLLEHGFEGASAISNSWIETMARAPLGPGLMPGVHLVRRQEGEIQLPVTHICRDADWVIARRDDQGAT